MIRVCSPSGVVHIGLVASFWIFVKFASRLLPDGWVKLKTSGCRCHFRAFQLELDTLDTKNFGIGSVVTKLQLFKVGRFWKISENPGLARRSFPYGQALRAISVLSGFRSQKNLNMVCVFFLPHANAS